VEESGGVDVQNLVFKKLILTFVWHFWSLKPH